MKNETQTQATATLRTIGTRPPQASAKKKKEMFFALIPRRCVSRKKFKYKQEISEITEILLFSSLCSLFFRSSGLILFILVLDLSKRYGLFYYNIFHVFFNCLIIPSFVSLNFSTLLHESNFPIFPFFFVVG